MFTSKRVAVLADDKQPVHNAGGNHERRREYSDPDLVEF
jgi:hypothetical protein